MTEITPISQEHLPVVEPELPPTSITPEARKQLEKMQFTPEEVHQLQELTRQYRYDQCDQKIARIAQNILVSQKYVVLPDFLQYGSKQGQCLDLSISWQLAASQWLTELNHQRQERGVAPLYTARFSGNAPYFFTGLRDLHWWNGVVTKNERGLLQEVLHVDASLQIISKPEELFAPFDSSYRRQQANISEKLTKAPVHACLETAPGLIDFDRHTIEGESIHSIVLGLSHDRRFIYSLGFLHNRYLNRLEPYLCVLNQQGGYLFYFYEPEEDLLMHTAGRSLPINEPEVIHILHTAHQANLTKIDNKTAQQLRLERSPISSGP